MIYLIWVGETSVGECAMRGPVPWSGTPFNNVFIHVWV